MPGVSPANCISELIVLVIFFSQMAQYEIPPRIANTIIAGIFDSFVDPLIACFICGGNTR
jgi:hypothetical protein